jgi:hypothetical protein
MMKSLLVAGCVFWVMTTPSLAFDWASYGELLRQHVRGGKVNYAALKKQDGARLQRLYQNLSAVNATQLGDAKHELAFWLNAYNIIVLREVTAAYPVKDVWTADKNFFKKKHSVAGKQLSLDDLEKEIISKQFRDARAYFGVNCASASCPILPPEPFTGDNVNARLDENARAFINDEANVRFDESSGTLHLSKIFDWYAADFERSAGSVEKFLARYLPYDWSLNELKP